LEECEHSHYEATRRILNWCSEKGPVIFAGYNSMKFDEIFLRQALYQNLHGAYLTNTNGNSRADIMQLVQGFLHHAPGVLTPVMGNSGRQVLRLGDLARANGIDLSEEDAHDALADVRATVALSRVMRDGEPEIWNALMQHSNRFDVDAFLADQTAFFASFFYGGRPFSYVMCEAARNRDDAKEVALFDLTRDPQGYMAMTVDELVEVLHDSPKVIRTIRTNNQPTLIGIDHPSPFLRGEMPDQQVLEDRVNVLRESDEFRANLAVALTQRYEPFEPGIHVEEKIYDGFPSAADSALMDSFHTRPVDERYGICQNFEDDRLRELGSRIIHSNWPDHLPDGERVRISGWIQQRHHDGEAGPWRTVDAAITEIGDLERENPDDAEEFAALRRYINDIAAPLG